MRKIKPWQQVWRLGLLFAAFFGLSVVLQAQTITITADKTSLTAGESVELRATSSQIADLSAFIWQSMEEGGLSFIPLSTKGPSLTVTPLVTTTYRGYIESPFARSNELTITVVVPKDLVIVNVTGKTELALGEEVTLRVESETGLPLGSVRWEKRMGNNDWEEIILPALGESITDTPEAGSTCYRAFYVYDVSGEKVYSEEVCVTSEYKCASNSAYVIFTDDFGKLDSETARNSNQYVGSEYSYVSGCGWLKDEGTYAVMANARYGGCNVDGVTDGCGCTHASNDQMWFRNIYDHTQGGVDSENKYGGMLLVNADEQLVYSRTITLPCANTNLIFSAWFATASKGATSSVRFFVKDSKGNEIKEATFPIEDIDFADGWIKGETSFYTGDETTFTVEIHNYREGTDKGNDFLVDDISFSVCSPEIGLYAETASDQVEIDAANNMVQGPCGEPITLQVKTSMVDVIFDTPQYLWFIKEADDTDFQLLPNANNLTAWRTTVSPYTQYYVVTAATPEDAQNYLDGKFTCTPVAVSNTITVLCTPNLEITLQSRECSDIVLKGTAYDAPNDFYFWWEKSTDGKNWQKIPRAAKTDTLHYALSEPLYFRINSEYTPSDPTEKLDVKALTLKANPDKGISGSLVQLIATATNLNMDDGALYQWYRYEDQENPDRKDHWWLITVTTDPALEHAIDRPVDRIMVTADGCEDEVEIKEITFDIEPIDVKCNDIYLQPVATLGGEPIAFKWQRSADGSEWNDVAEDSIHIEQDENLGNVARITIYENSMFRLAEIDAAGNETGLYSLIHPLPFEDKNGNVVYDYYTVKKIGLTATPSSGIAGTEVELNASQEGLDTPNGVFYNWFKFNDERQDWELLDGTDATRNHTIDAPIAQFKVKIDGCEEEVTVKELQFDIEPIDVKCNDIYMQPIATLGGEAIDYKWQRSADGVTWEDVDASAIKTVQDDNLGEVVVITISEKSMFRLAALNAFGNNTELYSSTEQAQFYEVKTLTLTADPAKIKKDSGAKLTLAYENFEATTAAQWFVVKGDNDEEFTPSSSTEHIIASLSETTTYKVTWDLCEATATVNVIQPASVAFMSRDCNEITMQATVDDTYGDFFWETSKDGIEWEKLAGKENQTSINVTITETTYFRVNNALDMPSDASYANDVHSITLEVDKEEINRDEQVTLTATADFSSNFAIKWYQNGEEIDNTANPYSPTLQTDATFYVELEGCESESVSINVIQPASVEFVSRVCNEITLSATVEEGVSYKWQKSKDGNTWTDMSETGSPITVTITENTKFRVKTDDVESEPTDIIELWGVTLSVDKNSVILGEEVNVTATSSSSEPIVWYENNQLLDFDGEVYTVKPYGPTSFQVTQGGCPSKTVTVTDVVWPTVFTPMAIDGFNDDFIIGMDPKVALQVFDRYGNLVVETTDGWDGKDKKGNYALPGVYYYVATLPNGEIVKGNVELLNEKK